MSDLQIRNATIQDSAAIVSLVNLAYEDAHWFKQPRFYNRIDSNVAISNFIVGILDNVIVGCLSCTQDNGTATISMLSIHPQYQKRGLARQLFDHCCKLSMADIIQVEVVNLQEHLVQIYKSWGFLPTRTATWEEMGVDSSVNIKITSHFVVMQRVNKHSTD